MKRNKRERRQLRNNSGARQIHPEAERAVRLIQSHKAVSGGVSPPKMLDDGGFQITFNMEVSLPSRAKALGLTETGVMAQESVTLVFPPSYPFRAPCIYLRHDFNRSFPHLNAMRASGERGLVPPCVYDGNLDELMQQYGDGLSEILNHLSEWLGKAAINDLIDSRQGWEPVRRDQVLGWMIFDAEKLRSIAENQQDGGAVFLACKYSPNLMIDNEWMSRVSGYGPVPMSPASLGNILTDRMVVENVEISGSLTLFAWPGVVLNETIAAAGNTYLPENVTNLKELLERASSYGCGDFIRSKLKEFSWTYGHLGLRPAAFPLFVILCARRPYNLIGQSSSLELIPYALDCKFERGSVIFAQNDLELSAESSVLPMAHRHALSQALLRQVSGVRKPRGKGPIVQLGCGSVGSKIIMHLARCGEGPFLLCDKSAFSPHNAARHALVGHPEMPGQPKAALLALEVARLRQEAQPDFGDIVDKCHGIGIGKDRFQPDARLIIEATGSMSVREALASLPADLVPGRVLHTALLAGGEVGLLTIEGPNRNPNINDLFIKLLDLRIDNGELAARLNRASQSLQRHDVGQGCSSYTMAMPDTRVSVFASGMAERARQVLDEATRKAEIWVGLLDECKLGVNWKCRTVGKTIVLKKEQWRIRLLKDAADQIDNEVKASGNIETGGVLIGCISIIHQRFTISRVLPAPPDSVRTESSFVLGIQGLREAVSDVWSRSEESLTYVGVWHSHPNGGVPSPLDIDSLLEMRKHRLGVPCLSLIWTPGGYEALVDDGKVA